MGVVVTHITSRERQNTALQMLREFQNADIPIVVYGDEPAAQEFDRVTSDQRAGSALLTRYFLQRGRTGIAMMCGPNDDFNWYRARRAGYEDALREADLSRCPCCKFPASNITTRPANGNPMCDW